MDDLKFKRSSVRRHSRNATAPMVSIILSISFIDGEVAGVPRGKNGTV